MRWTGLEIALAGWFAEALAAGQDQLARRIVGLLTVLREREPDVGAGLCALLDTMDRGETARRERGGRSPASIEDIAGAVDDLLEVLTEARLWPPRRRSEEAGVPYAVGSGQAGGAAGSAGVTGATDVDVMARLWRAPLSSASYRDLARTT